MQIQSIHFLPTPKNLKQHKKDNNFPSTNTIQQGHLPLFAYKDYNLSFKARLNRTPENFYEQKFNIDNMPATVKKYLLEDFEERHHMPPAQLQREAFEYLKLADSVQDVKDMYPDEPLFAKLKEAKDTKPSSGILLLLKWDAQTSNTPVFKDSTNKELTTYLLKKVYLEGKTIDELNKDFDKDATDEIKRELGVKDKKYFSNSTIRALGIRYPNLSYYNSFLATRNDKEYVPPVRKSGGQFSAQTKEKLSASMTKWWAGLNEIERSEQIQKMLNGKEMTNSIFARYQGQIMTIAAAQIGFSEKLSEIFADKYSDENFVIDFPSFSEQQREIMLEFWNKDPEFRKQYSQALQSIISDFEIAYYNYSEDKSLLESLLNKALDLKEKIINKAREKQHITREMKKLTPLPESKQEQEITSPEKIRSKDILKYFRALQEESMKFYPEDFKKDMMEFLNRNLTFKEKQNIVLMNQPDAQKILNMSDEQFAEALDKSFKRLIELDNKFNLEYPLKAKTVNFVLDNMLYKLINEPSSFKLDRNSVIEAIKLYNLEQKVADKLPFENREMNTLLKEQRHFKTKFYNYSDYISKTSELNIKNFINTGFSSALKQKLETGFNYTPTMKDDNFESVKNLFSDVAVDKQETNKFLLNNYALIKFITDTKNEEKARDIALERLICDYVYFVIDLGNHNSEKLTWISKDNQTSAVDVQPQDNGPLTSQPPVRSDFDINSQKNVNKFFKTIMSSEMSLYTDILKKAYIDFVMENTPFKMKREFVAIGMQDAQKLLNTDTAGLKKILKTMTEHGRELTRIFESKYPIIAQTNDFLINKYLYELTKDPYVFTLDIGTAIDYINNHNLSQRMLQQMPKINDEMKKLCVTANKKMTEEFTKTVLKPELDKKLKLNGGFKYYPELNGQLNDIDKLMNLNTQFVYTYFYYLKNYNAAIKYYNSSMSDDNAKEAILENILCSCIKGLRSFVESRIQK